VLALARRALGEEAAVVVEEASAGEERVRAFYAAWTRHEARLKVHGGGLGGGPSEPLASAAVAIGAGYAAAFAVPGETAPPQRLYLPAPL